MFRALAVVLLAVVALVGCADAPVAPATGPPGTVAPAPRPGPAAVDAAFLSGMIPHHQQALDLTAMVAERDASAGLEAIALRIDREQVEEIGQMRGLMRARGLEPVPVPMMAGMASPETLATVRTLRGPAFERRWLDTMVRHHEGALVMAQDYLAAGTDETLRRFCRVLLDGQSQEIALMQGLRTGVAGS